jgi:hypothetical protein
MHQNTIHPRHMIASLLGGLEALLLVRLALRLLAARPDQPVFAALFAITAPPRALAFLDAGQPRFGAVLEFSTLALAVLPLCVGLILRRVWRAPA